MSYKFTAVIVIFYQFCYVFSSGLPTPYSLVFFLLLSHNKIIDNNIIGK